MHALPGDKNKKEKSSSMKLLTTMSVDYFESCEFFGKVTKNLLCLCHVYAPHEVPFSSIIFKKKAEISTADISKTQKLKPEWIKSTTG